MAESHHDVTLEPGDSISITDRLTGNGCTLTFARDAVVYLTAQHETELLVMLMERQTGVGRAQAAYSLIGGMDGAQIAIPTIGRRPHLAVVKPTGGAT